MVPDAVTWCRPDWDHSRLPNSDGWQRCHTFRPEELSPAPAELSGFSDRLGGGSRHRKSSGEKMPRVSGAECFGGTSNDRIGGRSTKRRLARLLRSLCDGDHQECAFCRELSRVGRRSVAVCAWRGPDPRRVPRCWDSTLVPFPTGHHDDIVDAPGSPANS